MLGIQPDAGLGLVDSERVKGIEEGANASVKSTLTAQADGTQANATTIPPAAQLVRVNTVAGAADSVKLPFAIAGAVKLIANDSAAQLAVFARNGTNRATGTTDTINALANGTAFAIAAGGRAAFFCPVNGKWFAILSA